MFVLPNIINAVRLVEIPGGNSGMFVPEVCEKHDSEALVDVLHTSQMDFLYIIAG